MDSIAGIHADDVKRGIVRSEWKLLLPLFYTVLFAACLLRGLGIRDLIWPPIMLAGLMGARYFNADWIFWLATIVNAAAATVYVLVIRRKRGGHFGEFMDEELRYRVGSENWSLVQKAYSCAHFGVTRMGKFFYPVSAIITTALTGAAYLRIYHKAGLLGVVKVRYAVLNVLVYGQKLLIVTVLEWVCIN